MKRETDEYVVEYEIKTIIIRVTLLILLLFLSYIIFTSLTNSKNEKSGLLNYTLIEVNEKKDITQFGNSRGDLYSIKPNIYVQGDINIENENGTNILYLSNFKITNNKNLVITLSTTIKGLGLIEIGRLKGNIGNQKYIIPSNVDLTKHKYILIRDSVKRETHAYAELK